MARKQNVSQKFIFRKHMNIGAADAIEDRKFLQESFVDNGELAILTDVLEPQCVVLGRTGSGKTALLEKIEGSKERVIKVEPEDLALGYISDSSVLRFFIDLGVNMDLFYRLLWRHVFAVELIRSHYRIINQEAQDSFWEKVIRRFSRDQTKQEAIEYLRQWGESFWLKSEYRIQEITKKLEKDLKNSIGAEFAASVPLVGNGEILLSSEHTKSLSEEERGEIIERGQAVINKVQMSALSNVMRLLENELLDDKKKQYYIVIDRLDENWVHDEFRYHLIRSLIDTIRDFNRTIENVKIIVAIREDLLDRVFRYSRTPGYQEEKYRSMYLQLSWTTQDLETLLDKRVNQIIREQYTTKTIRLADLFPNKVYKLNPLQYFFDRTLYRPRDAIMFFNQCIQASQGKAKFTQTTISQAENYYSEDRLRALADEWAADYPNLIELILFLRKYPSQFDFSHIREDIEDHILRFLVADHPKDTIYHLALTHFENGTIEVFIPEMLRILYKVGVIGVKPNSYSTVQWSHQGQRLFRDAINETTSIHVHPAFWRTLGIQPV